MNHNIISKLHLEPRIRDLKHQGYSERNISKILSDETKLNISKSAVHRVLQIPTEPPRADAEPVPIHEPTIEPEPQHSDTVLLTVRESVETYMKQWQKEHSSINLSNYLYFCDDFYHHCRNSAGQKISYSDIKNMVCEIKGLSPKIRMFRFKQPADRETARPFTIWMQP